MNYIIEIATTDLETTRLAIEGGADRIELCASLVEGGITPSYGTMKMCREQFDVPIFPIVRPRSGDFLYTEAEYRMMLHDIELIKSMGFEGIVTGFLHADGTVDYERTAKAAELAFPMEITFHRAFDRSREPFEAMESIIRAGCQRILTSGQMPAAPEGIELIRRLVDTASGRIIIMPGSGVRNSNIRAIAEGTGASEFHSSLRGSAASKMEFRQPAFSGSSESYTVPYIDPAEVKALRNALQ